MILVTGGAGFIGSNIVADLNERGRKDIVIADRLGSDHKWKNVRGRSFEDIIPPEEIPDFLSSSRDISAVIHMGAISATTARDADEVISNNFRLSTRLWDWCAQSSVPFIYASSAATYGGGSEGFKDDSSECQLKALRPLNLYGWSKHAFDKWAMTRVSANVYPPQWVGLKFFNVYGPNEWHKGNMQSLASKLSDQLRNGERVRLFKSHKPGYADGEQLRDFVYVRDCTSVIMWLLDTPSVSGLFNLGTGVASSFRTLVTSMAKAFGLEAEIEYVDMPAEIREQYQYYTQADMTKLRSHGYGEPLRSVSEGTADFARTFLAQGDGYR